MSTLASYANDCLADLPVAVVMWRRGKHQYVPLAKVKVQLDPSRDPPRAPEPVLVPVCLPNRSEVLGANLIFLILEQQNTRVVTQSSTRPTRVRGGVLVQL